VENTEMHNRLESGRGARVGLLARPTHLYSNLRFRNIECEFVVFTQVSQVRVQCQANFNTQRTFGLNKKRGISWPAEGTARSRAVVLNLGVITLQE